MTLNYIHISNNYYFSKVINHNDLAAQTIFDLDKGCHLERKD